MSRFFRRASIANTVLLCLLLALVISIILLAAVPPVSRDALIHHLAIPKLYLEHGGIFEIPELSFSYYPMNLDLLYMGALYLGSDILPKYIHMAFGFATCFLIFQYLKKRLPIKYAYLGSLFFLSIPIIIKLSVTVYVDLGLCFFSLASIYLIFSWAENNWNLKYLIFAGGCCGLAVGTKYNGLLVLFILTCITPLLYLRHVRNEPLSNSRALTFSLIFLFFAILVASPWFIRNVIWTGNPIYPLYDNIFSASLVNSSPDQESNKITGVFTNRQLLYGENAWDILLLPVRIFFQGEDGNPRLFDGRLNPFLLILPLFALFKNKQKDKYIKMESILLISFCILYFLFSVQTNVLRIRYLAPIIAPLIILSMYGLSYLELFLKDRIKEKMLQRSVLFLVIASMLGINIQYIVQQFKIIQPVNFIRGQVTRDSYVSKRHPEYSVINYANHNLPADTKILCMFLGWRSYYFKHTVIFDHHYNPGLLIALLYDTSLSPSEILSELSNKQITHVLIRTDLFIEWLKTIPTDRQLIWDQIYTLNLKMIISHNDYQLFQIETD